MLLSFNVTGQGWSRRSGSKSLVCEVPTAVGHKSVKVGAGGAGEGGQTKSRCREVGTGARVGAGALAPGRLCDISHRLLSMRFENRKKKSKGPFERL